MLYTINKDLTKILRRVNNRANQARCARWGHGQGCSADGRCADFWDACYLCVFVAEKIQKLILVQ